MTGTNNSLRFPATVPANSVDFQSVPLSSYDFLATGFRSELRLKIPMISWLVSTGTRQNVDGTGRQNSDRNPVARKSPELKRNRQVPTEEQ